MHKFVPFLVSTGLAVSSLAVAEDAEWGLDARPATTCTAPPRPSSGTGVRLVQAFPNLTFTGLLAMVQNPAQPSYWYVLRKSGYIYRFQNSDAATSLSLVANLTDRVKSTAEGGLLGMAFHPAFATNGYVYVYYTTDKDPSDAVVELWSRLVRFTSTDGGATLNTASQQILFEIPQPAQYHHAGSVLFGADGYLYISIGDAGKQSNAQDHGQLAGAILRIDVDSGSPYAIPPGNPFAGGGGRGERYAWGFRNPWRMTFDRQTGEIWVGDVGRETWEEVDKVVKGGNYGWPIREGAHCADGTTNCSTTGLIDPIIDYNHATEGRCVIGGYVYRGSAIGDLFGTYVHGDWSNGLIWGLTVDGSGRASRQTLVESGLRVMSFGEGTDGELFVVSPDKIFRIVPASTGGSTGSFPRTLSATGLFDPSDPRQPADCLIPYEVNAPLWSDGADKERYLSLPAGGTIKVLADGDWELPIGTVLVKSFWLQASPIETRLLVRHSDGEWAGYSYRWNDSGTDATLLEGADTRVVGGQTWSFPSRAQCLECHTAAANRVLGLETAQLNREVLYPSTGRVANQIATFQHIGLFSPALSGTPATLPRFPEYEDETAPVEERARAYLHSNCSHCHRPDGGGRGLADLRHYVSFAEMNVCDALPVAGDLGVSGARLLAPGDPAKSLIALRQKTNGSSRMPPLARSIVDVQGTAIVDAWIDETTECPEPPPPAASIVLDNGQPGTSRTGTWSVSGGAGAYGADSLYSKGTGATYTYQVALPAPGEYEVSLWWTQYPSRLTNVPVSVTHATGTSNVTVNQQTNGGKWNAIGRWTFGATAKIVITSLGVGSTCADAVQLVATAAPPPPPPPEEIVLDNGQPGTSWIGSWPVSGGPSPWGANSVYSKYPGDRYTFSVPIPQSGSYDVYAWWTYMASRSSAVPISIQHASGTAAVQVDQTTGGGQWNKLGTWSFSGQVVATIASAGGNLSTCADAIKVVPAGGSPPPPPPPAAELILDNGQPGTSKVGLWPVSGGPSPYGADSVYSKYPGDTYRFTFAVPQAGTYEVYAWWTYVSSRSSAVPISIQHAGGTATVQADQTTGGGRWNRLGAWSFGTSAVVTITSLGSAYSTCADAVRLVQVSP